MQFFNDTAGGHDTAGGVQHGRDDPTVQYTVDIVAHQFGFHVECHADAVRFQPVRSVVRPAKDRRACLWPVQPTHASAIHPS